MKRVIGKCLAILIGISLLGASADAQEVQAGNDGTLMLKGVGDLVTLTAGPGQAGARLIFNVHAMERGTFFGVVTTPIPPALREQLKLKNGLGVLVESVEQDSPAAAAGIKQYDVLEKLDDQWLINAQQLAVLVRMHANGDKINVSIIRQGQRESATATLSEKDVPTLDLSSNWGLPMGETAYTGGTLTIMGNVNTTSNTDPKFLKRMFTNPPREMRISTSDERYRTDYSVKDGKSQLTLKDRNGATIYDGPVDTEEQRSKLPDEVKKMLMDLTAQQP